MTQSETPPRSFVVLCFAVFCAGILGLSAGWTLYPTLMTSQLLLLLAAAVVSENYALELKTFTVSISSSLIVAALITGGPAASGLVAALCFTNLHDLRLKRPIYFYAFNFGQLVTAATLAGFVYAGVGAPVMTTSVGVSPLQSFEAPLVIPAVLLASAVFTGTNMTLTAVGVRFTRGIPYRQSLRLFSQHLPTQIALSFVGLLVAQVLSINPIAFPFFLFPLFLARQIYQRYAAFKDAYVDTVRSLIGALEAKDPYTRGHSERVSGYAAALAERTGLSDDEVESVRQAALLHDIGKLAMPGHVLVKPSNLNDQEYAAMRRHPWVGGEMVTRIPALRGLSEYVRCHHERIDGSGYPVGLLGDEIPDVAKIIAVADAYDAMTTHRAYRTALPHEEAVAELIKGAGAQFEDHLVRSFIEASLGVSPRQDEHVREHQCGPAGVEASC